MDRTLTIEPGTGVYCWIVRDGDGNLVAQAHSKEEAIQKARRLAQQHEAAQVLLLARDGALKPVSD
jgi:Uncharacterized protein conserved in bacteria (DUF2188)